MRIKGYPKLIHKEGVVYQADCLDLLPQIPSSYVDLILCDLPYNTTGCEWDQLIPFKPLWKEYWRILKPNAVIVLTGSQPFTSSLISSQINHFKYEWIWMKTRPTGHVHSKNKPMKKHENICVFSKGVTVHANQTKSKMPYNPQGLLLLSSPVVRKNHHAKHKSAVLAERNSHRDTLRTHTNYPNSILEFSSEYETIHPTQKPVSLFEYLIRTYTNERGVVLDNCIGSGTTAIAALQSNRRFIGIEKDEKFYEIACNRIRSYRKGLF